MPLGTISFRQQPVETSLNLPAITNWTPIIGYMVYQDDISGLYYFKLILEVRLVDSTGTLIAKIKQRSNGFGSGARAMFDLKEIINSQLVSTIFDQNDDGVPFRTIHKLGVNDTTKVFSLNGDRNKDKWQIQEIYVKGYQQYSSSESQIPSVNSTTNVDTSEFFMAASLPLMTARSTVVSTGSPTTGFIQGDAFDKYQMSSATDCFLSDTKTYKTSIDFAVDGSINYVYWNDDTNTGDYHTLGYLNDNSNFSSNAVYMQITYYDSSNAALTTTYILSSSGNGGISPVSANEDKERLLYYGCGPGNLEAQTVTGDSLARPSNVANNNWAYYSVRATNVSTPSFQSKPYYFVRQDGSCKGFKVRRLAWVNSLGCYDYFNFRLKSSQTIEVERKNYGSVLGTYDKSFWRYNNTQRGKATLNTSAVLKETITTDWLVEEEAYLMEKLIMSKEVHIVENQDTEFTEAVLITNNSFVKKTKANDRLIQYTFEIEYANPINTNS